MIQSSSWVSQIFIFSAAKAELGVVQFRVFVKIQGDALVGVVVISEPKNGNG
jgi:hypothetical protein